MKKISSLWAQLHFKLLYPRVPFIKIKKACCMYGQVGQDIVLSKLISDMFGKQHFVMLELGCNDPIKMSNSYLVSRLFKFTHYAVDANPIHASSWNKYRPDTKFICCALGASQTDLVLVKKPCEVDTHARITSKKDLASDDEVLSMVTSLSFSELLNKNKIRKRLLSLGYEFHARIHSNDDVFVLSK